MSNRNTFKTEILGEFPPPEPGIGKLYVFFRSEPWDPNPNHDDTVLRLEFEIVRVEQYHRNGITAIGRVEWSPNSEAIGQQHGYPLRDLRPLDPVSLGLIYQKLFAPAVELYRKEMNL